MSTIPQVLTAMKTILADISVSPTLSNIWTHPGDASSITVSYPFAVISKINSEVGSWNADSYGAGVHNWSLLIAIYLAEGPIIVTNNSIITVAAMTNADQYYKALSDLLYQNMTLNNTVQFIGDGEGKLFDYVTDNLMWDARQHYGHLFMIPVTQRVIQAVSA